MADVSGLSNYGENQMLNWLFGGGPATQPASRWVSLHGAAPDETGSPSNELDTSGVYDRKVVTFTDASGTPGPGAVQNVAQVQWTNSDANSWSVTHFGLWDASSGGNFLGGGALTASKTVGNNDTATFAAGDLDISLN